MIFHFRNSNCLRAFLLTVVFTFCCPALFGQDFKTIPKSDLESYLATLYSPDVLNCEVCRERLGLPPLAKANLSNVNTGDAAILPSPKHSFPARNARPTQQPVAGNPPSPSSDLSQLSFIERQRLMSEIEVPEGGRILSFRILEPSKIAPQQQPTKIPGQSNETLAPETWNLPSKADQRFTPPGQPPVPNPKSNSTSIDELLKEPTRLVAQPVTLSEASTEAKPVSFVHSNDDATTPKDCSSKECADEKSCCEESEKSALTTAKTVSDDTCCEEGASCCKDAQATVAKTDDAKCCDEQAECKESCCRDEKNSKSLEAKTIKLEDGNGQSFTFTVTGDELDQGNLSQEDNKEIRVVVVAGDDGEKGPKAMVLRSLPRTPESAPQARKRENPEKTGEQYAPRNVQTTKPSAASKTIDLLPRQNAPSGKQIQDLTLAINRLTDAIQRMQPQQRDQRSGLPQRNENEPQFNEIQQSSPERQRREMDQKRQAEMERNMRRQAEMNSRNSGDGGGQADERVNREEMQQAMEMRARELQAQHKAIEVELKNAHQRMEQMQRAMVEKNAMTEKANAEAKLNLMRQKEALQQKLTEVEELKKNLARPPEQKAKSAKGEPQKKKQPKP